MTTCVKSRPNQANKRMEVWKILDNFLQILRLQVCTPTYENDFRKAIKALIDSIQEAWGRKDITYYLVSNILL